METTSESSQESVARPISLATVGRFLICDRQAIVDMAANRHVVWLGLLLVLSAGFAREYDAEYLLREPWHLLLPLAASLATSLILFLLLFVVAWVRSARPTFWSSYRAFLGVYWMTAPLAWFYAIPVERFLSEADAVRVNLLFLGIVSLWRVLLMIQIVAVVFRCQLAAALMLVMLFADAVALVMLRMAPFPILNIMGGIGLNESERALQEVACSVMLFGIVSAPIWALGSLAVLLRRNEHWKLHSAITQPGGPGIARGVWVCALGLLVLGLAILPVPQMEQASRWRVERLLLAGRVSEGLSLMSSSGPDAFPPYWQPPPRRFYGETSPSMNEVVDALATDDVADWVQAVFWEKLSAGRHSPLRLEDMTDDQLERYVQFLSQTPDGKQVAQRDSPIVEYILKKEEEASEMTPRRRRLFERYLKSAE